jgi:hypothetical protein
VGGKLFTAVVGLSLLVPAGAEAKPLKLGFVSLSQRTVLKQGAVRVRVTSRRAGRVRVFVASRRGKVSVVSTRTKTVKLRARHRRTVRLKLTRAGRRELSGCVVKRKLVATAVPVKSLEKGTGKLVTFARPMKRDRNLCRHPPSGGSGGSGGGTGGAPNGPGEQRPIDFATPSDASRCDFLDLAVCLQPWPNDYFTIADKSTDTGRRLNLDVQSMPRNVENKPIEPSDYNRNDGFSPGAMIVTRVPGLDTKAAFDKSGIVPNTDMAKAFAPNQPVVLINTRTNGRSLAWAEIDANPKDPANVNLIIRPGRNLQEATRYVVALRDLKDAAGKPIAPTKEFKLYRDRTLTTNKAVEDRRAHMESLFKTLSEAGIDRDGLVRAWDFTTASEANLTERMLAIRDDAFKMRGDTNLADLTVQGTTPSFVVTRSIPTPDDANIDHLVEGKVLVPCYLDKPGCPPGSRFLYPPGSTHGPPVLDGAQANMYDANFRCIVPKVAMAQGGARVSLYGHGLFGSRGEVEQGQLKDMAQEHNIVFCATEWIGMSCPDIPGQPPVPGSPDPAYFEQLQRYFNNVLSGRQQAPSNCDVPNVATILHDLSNFPTLSDRVQQGMLDFMYLGRAMIHPDGFVKDPAFLNLAGGPILDTRRLFYDGNSQGGIIGGSLIAVEPDLDRGVLGVPGMNYSTLLTRSTDFGTGKTPDPTKPGLPEYAYALYQSYPNELERPLLFSLMQTLWDRAEANGYALHMTSDPLRNTPAHRVLMQAGLGDHQVAQVAAETEARTIGAYTREPYVDPGRDNDVAPAYGLPRIGSYPFDGSAFMLFDIGPPRQDGTSIRGTNPPPTSNTPPARDGQEDPHEFPRRSFDGRRQKDAFLRIGGSVFDVCGPRPCYAGTWHGP